MIIYCISLIIFAIGILTIVFSFWSLKLIHQNPALHNAFGYISAGQSFADAGVAACFAFWAAPILFFTPSITSESIGFAIGNLICFFYYCAIWLHLCKSLNRCYAVVFPIHYRIAFNTKNVIILIAIAMILAALCSGTSFMYSCNYSFDIETLIWTSRSWECEETISKFTDMGAVFISAIGSVVFDVITSSYLIMFNKNSKLNYGLNAYNEKKFFAQTCLTTFIHIVSVLFSYVIVDYTEDIVWIFILSTVNWQLLHLFNQIFFIAFTINIKDVKKRFSILSNASRVVIIGRNSL